MNIFNSLGSNYDLKFVLNSSFTGSGTGADEKLRKYLEDKYSGKATLLYKGREAIELALKLAGLPEGSAVAINGFTCYAVYKAITDAGYKVEYIDIGESDLHFSSDTLKDHISKNPAIKAVIIQNTLGYTCKIEEIVRLCKKYNLILIEDLAHSVGAVYANGKEAGTGGDFTVLSFSQDKIIDAVSGGALVIRTKKYQNIESFRPGKIQTKQQLRDKCYPLLTFIIRETYKFGPGKVLHAVLRKFHLLSQPMGSFSDKELHSLSGWYCGIVLKQFKISDENLSHRRMIASIYAKKINPGVLKRKITDQIAVSGNLRFPIFTQNRDNLIKYLSGFGVYVSDIWYDAPIAPKKYLMLTDYQHQCPVAEKVSSEILNLPTHSNITEKQALMLSEKINLWLKSQPV